MNVNSSNSTAVGSPNPLSATSPARLARGGEEATPATTDATITELSGPAQLMSRLSQLRDSDPEQFTQLVSSLASQLHEAAKQDSGLGGTEFASKLEDVAHGGDISKLEPPADSPPPDGPPPGAGPDLASARSSSAANAYRSTSQAHTPENDAGPEAIAKMLEELDAALKTV
jgi:hypothetical protein